jgi:hypothetical protein
MDAARPSEQIDPLAVQIGPLARQVVLPPE